MAEKESREVLSLRPASIQALLILGNSSMYQKKYDESRRSFEAVIRLKPDEPPGVLPYGFTEFGREWVRILP